MDPHYLMRLNSPLVVVIQRQRGDERPVVISTDKIDWRDILCNNSLEITREMQPVDLKHKGSLGILTVEMDVHPYLSKEELLTVDTVKKQQDMEKKFETEQIGNFLEYAKDWYMDYKGI
jgi:hypothetical protein